MSVCVTEGSPEGGGTAGSPGGRADAVFVCLCVTEGSPEGGSTAGSLSEAVVHAVLTLLRKDVAEHGRHLPQYFSFFLLYAAGGLRERTHLLKVTSQSQLAPLHDPGSWRPRTTARRHLPPAQ